jgi:hypothetical protein
MWWPNRAHASYLKIFNIFGNGYSTLEQSGAYLFTPCRPFFNLRFRRDQPRALVNAVLLGSSSATAQPAASQEMLSFMLSVTWVGKELKSNGY